jgi:serine/threonine protein phosphatase PrpC
MASLLTETLKGSSYVEQNRSAQDVAIYGSNDDFNWIIIADGHGRNSSGYDKTLLNHLLLLDWDIILKDPNFHKIDEDEEGILVSPLFQTIYDLADKNKYGSLLSGSTLSIVKIFPDRFECFYIGDSTIKIYANTVDNSEQFTRIFMSKNHDIDHDDIQVLASRSGGCTEWYRKNWMNGRNIYQNGIIIKNVHRLNVLSDKDITMSPSFYSFFDGDSKNMLNMTRAIGHIPSKEFRERAKKENIELSLPQKTLTTETIMREPGKKYCVIAASDGLWDIACDKDDNLFVSLIKDDPYSAAKNIVDFAVKRWGQEWYYNGKLEKLGPLQRDDIGVACVFV